LKLLESRDFPLCYCTLSTEDPARTKGRPKFLTEVELEKNILLNPILGLLRNLGYTGRSSLKVSINHDGRKTYLKVEEFKADLELNYGPLKIKAADIKVFRNYFEMAVDVTIANNAFNISTNGFIILSGKDFRFEVELNT